MRPNMMDPMRLNERLWPKAKFYDRQVEIIYSVEENIETLVPAANKVGKDFICGNIAPNIFIRARLAGYTCRIITTSVKDDHLRVLWGEINRFIQTSAYPLSVDHGGPLKLNHRDIRWHYPGSKCEISYLLGTVSESGEGLSGHHADVTLIIGDESSGLHNDVHAAAQGWGKRFLYIGNPNMTDNFWKEAIEVGDILA